MSRQYWVWSRGDLVEVDRCLWILLQVINKLKLVTAEGMANAISCPTRLLEMEEEEFEY